MRKVLREAIAEIRRQGGAIINITEAGRHTEVLIEIGLRRGVIRLHQGSRIKFQAERGLRASIRSIGRVIP